MNWLEKIAQEDLAIHTYESTHHLVAALNEEVPKYTWSLGGVGRIDEENEGWWDFKVVGSDALEVYRLHVKMFSDDILQRYRPTIGMQGLSFKAQLFEGNDPVTVEEEFETGQQIALAVKNYFGGKKNPDDRWEMPKPDPDPSGMVPIPVGGPDVTSVF